MGTEVKTDTTKIDETKVNEETKTEDVVNEDETKVEETKNSTSDLIRQLKKEKKELLDYKNNAEALKLKETNDFKTAYEKISKDFEALKENLKNSNLKNKFIVEAQKRNIIDPDLAFRALEDYKNDYTVDEDGSIDGLDKVFTKLIKDKPYLVASSKTSVLPNTSGKVTPGNEKIWTQAEFQALSFSEKIKVLPIYEKQLKEGLIVDADKE